MGTFHELSGARERVMMYNSNSHVVYVSTPSSHNRELLPLLRNRTDFPVWHTNLKLVYITLKYEDSHKANRAIHPGTRLG